MGGGGEAGRKKEEGWGSEKVFHKKKGGFFPQAPPINPHCIGRAVEYTLKDIDLIKVWVH